MKERDSDEDDNPPFPKLLDGLCDVGENEEKDIPDETVRDAYCFGPHRTKSNNQRCKSNVAVYACRTATGWGLLPSFMV